MIYCEYCGQGMELTDRYCPNCGAPAPVLTAAQAAAQNAQTAAEAAYVEETSTATTGDGEYSVILDTIGSCSASNATDLLRDALGYTIIEAQQLLGAVPTEVATNLTKEQAQYIAQALTEYGMSVEVLRNGSSVDLSGSATESVFDSAGSFIKKALFALGGPTSLNRLKKFTKLTRPSYYQQTIFRPNYRPEPPKHVRRDVNFRNEPPRPAPQPQNFGPGAPQPNWQNAQNVRPGMASRPQNTPNVRPGMTTARPQNTPNVRPGTTTARPQNTQNTRPGGANTRPGGANTRPGANQPGGPGQTGQGGPGGNHGRNNGPSGGRR